MNPTNTVYTVIDQEGHLHPYFTSFRKANCAEQIQRYAKDHGIKGDLKEILAALGWKIVKATLRRCIGKRGNVRGKNANFARYAEIQ